MPSLYLFDFETNQRGSVEIKNKKGDIFHISFQPDGDITIRKTSNNMRTDSIAVVPSCSNQIYLK